MSVNFLNDNYNNEITRMLTSYKVIICNDIQIQEPIRKHKKRRIQKKWEKRYGTHSVQDPSTIYIINDSLVMTEKCYQDFKKYIKGVEIHE